MTQLTPTERRAIFSLSSIMALRMIGLFMVIPVFALYAGHLPGSTPARIGLAVGIYGLFQALFQIPFGALSDKFGRKPMIVVGLILFIVGSILAGIAHSMTLMIIGRSLQGMGAVGSTILAMMADLTREEQSTKSMAIAGITIGFSFAIAFLIGPILTQWMPVSDLFYLAALFGIGAIVLLIIMVPSPITSTWHRDTEPELKSFLKLLVAPELVSLNIGIFVLHALFTASFVVIPISLHHFANLAANQQWTLYLPTLIAAFVISLFCIGMAERKQQIKPYFIGGIAALLISEILLWLTPANISFTTVALALFFGGFSLLEAFLPSLISRTAPAARKGSAMGIYSCAQFFGIFVGGAAGGALYGKFNFTGTYLFCLALGMIWLALAVRMRAPRFLTTQMWRVLPSQRHDWQTVASKLQLIPGMVEVTFIAEDGVAYLKMERATAKSADFLRLREQVVSEG